MQETAKAGVAARKMQVDFGDEFAYKGRDARGGKSGKGEKNGKEKDSEEGEKAPTDQAVAPIGKVTTGFKACVATISIAVSWIDG